MPSFSPVVSYPADATVDAVAVADFNGDGSPDMAVTSPNDSTVSVFLNNGDGAFGAAQTFGVGAYPTDITVGDFNSDGKIDIVTADSGTTGLSGSGATSVFLGNGDGTFQTARSTPTATVNALTTGDFNADGRLDVAVAGYWVAWNGEEYWQTGSVNVLLGRGDGTFDHSSGAIEVANLFALAIRTGDFNGDGKEDLVASTDYYQAVVYLGNGNGTFSGDRYLAPGELWYGAVALEVADFDGDGNQDVVSTNPNKQVSLFLGHGDGTFGSPRQSSVGAYAPSALVATDLNRDGLLDLVSANGSVSVLLGAGFGSFQAAQEFTAGVSPASLSAADFNGDGCADVAVANRASSDVTVMTNARDWPAVPPSIAVGDVTASEGNTGIRAATFTVTLSAATGQTVTVAYATAAGSATAGSDYQAASNPLTFAPGQTSKTITVLLIGDRLGEPNETFVVNLSSPTNSFIADGQGVGTILDDEPRISIGDVSKKEGKKNQTTLFTFTVTLSVAYDQPVTMSFKTTDGTATTGDSDYVARSGTLTFAPGETTKTITIEVKADGKKEIDETFYLDLFGLSSNALFTRNRGIGTILNDD
jgi:hypothetical protein